MSSRIDLELLHVVRPAVAEELHEALDQLLGRARARGDADDAHALEPLLLDLRLVVDQMRGGAVLTGDLDETVRVGGVAAADHQHQVALLGELLDRRLAVGGRVTDVVGAWPDDRGELLTQRAG